MDSSLYWNAEKMLKRYIYDYLVRRNHQATAITFRNEADVPVGPVAIDDSVEGFLLEWWQIFYEIYFGLSASQDPRIICQAVAQRMNERNAIRKMEQGSSSSTRAANPILQRPPPLPAPARGNSGLANYSSFNAMKDFRFATQPADHRLRNINPNLHAPIIRPPRVSTSSTNLIRNFTNAGSKRNAQPPKLVSKRPKVTATPQVTQFYRPPEMNEPSIGLPDTAPTRFASSVASQNEEIVIGNEEISLPNFGLNQFLIPTLKAYIQEQSLIYQRNSVADNYIVTGPQTDSSMEMLAQSNKGKQVDEQNEGRSKNKSICITANENNSGAMNETGGGLSPFISTSTPPENSLDFGSMAFSLSAADEFFKTTDFFTDDHNKNKGLEDFIDVNDVCFEDLEVEKFLLYQEKNIEKAGPSPTDDQESKQGSNEEEEVEKFFFSEDKDEKAGPSSTDHESKQGSNEGKDAAPQKGDANEAV